MDIDGNLLITRGPEGETHGNHMRAPYIGIADLQLSCSGNTSRFHVPEDSPKPTGARTGNDSFHFLPEHDVCELVFDIENPFDIVDRAKLELFKRFKKEPLWTLDLAKLGPTWLRHGKHTVKWDGRIIARDTALDGEIDGENTKHDLTPIAPKTDAAADAPFPDGWVTLEHPPYKLKLTLESDQLIDHPVVAWTYFHVLLEKIELKLGPVEAIPNDGAAPTLEMDKAVHKQMTDDGFPAAGATGKVFLISNLYKTSGAEFAAGSTADFTTYKTLWGDGPRIPIIAKLTMRAADGSGVDLETAAKGAVALGRAKFMWDVADPDEVPQATHANAQAFLTKTRNYYKNGTDTTRSAKDHTYFEGDNCHVDRGGVRGPDATSVFPAQDGYAPKDALDVASFPFTVGTKAKDPSKRKWAAFSHAWVKGKLKGHTGVLFRPGRMVGDNFIVSVQLAYDWKDDGTFTIDVTDKDLKLPAKITAKTGTLEVWRKIYFARYVRKTATVPDFMPSFPQIADFFTEAFVDFENKVTANDNYIIADHKTAPGGAVLDYNAACRVQLTALANVLYTKRIIASATEDHSTTAAAFRIVPYATFVQNVHTKNYNHPAADFTTQAAAAGVAVDVFAKGLGTAAALPTAAPVAADNARATRLNQTQAYLQSGGYDTLRGFAQKMQDLLWEKSKALTTKISLVAGCGASGAAAEPGITAIQFDYVHSGTQELIDSGQPDHRGKLGSAVDADDAKREKVVFMFVRNNPQTFAHECGHHLFLPHTNPPNAGATELLVHDSADVNGAGKPLCLMAYNERHGFCGFCQLRLRGWDNSKLKPAAADNEKT